MLPDRVSNPGPLTYQSGALPIALRGPALNSRKTHSAQGNRAGRIGSVTTYFTVCLVIACYLLMLTVYFKLTCVTKITPSVFTENVN